MLKQLLSIIKKPVFIISFISPILFVFLLKSDIKGNIFNLNTIIKYNLSFLIVSQYSNTAITLLALQLTLFILFFTFVQFSLSKQELPAGLIRKYIIESQTTMIFLGVQLSISCIFAFYSLYPKISFYQNLICLVLILSSVLGLIAYFFWIINNITHSSLFEMALSKLNVSKLRKIQSELDPNYKVLNTKLSESNNSKITTNDPDEYVRQELPHISTSQTGYVTKIDIDEIIKILSDYDSVIAKIIIKTTIGEHLPSLGSLFQDSYNKDLIIIVRNDINDKSKIDFEEYVKKSSNKLAKCFIINDYKKINLINFKTIKDVIEISFLSTSFEQSENEKMNYLLKRFLWKLIEDEEKKGQGCNGIILNLFYKQFVNVINEKVDKSNIRELNIRLVLLFANNFCLIAAKQQEIWIYEVFQKILINLHSKALRETFFYAHNMSNIISNLKEISFYTVMAIKINDNEFIEKQRSFYETLVDITLKNSISVYKDKLNCLHLKSMTENKKDLVMYLNDIIELFKALKYLKWKNFCGYEPDIKAMIKKIILISALTQNRLMENNEFFPLIKNVLLVFCFSISSMVQREFNRSDLFSYFFYTYNSNNIRDESLIYELGQSKINIINGFDIKYDIPQLFWLILAIYVLIKTGETQFPAKDILAENKEKSISNKFRLENMIEYIDKGEHKDLLDIFNINKNELNDLLASITNHFKDLLKEIETWSINK